MEVHYVHHKYYKTGSERRRGKVLRAHQCHYRKHQPLNYLHTTSVRYQRHKESVLLERLAYDQAAPNLNLAVTILVRQVARSAVRKMSGEAVILEFCCFCPLKRNKRSRAPILIFSNNRANHNLAALICNEVQACFGPMYKHNATNHVTE